MKLVLGFFLLVSLSLIPFSFSETVPDWVKNTAGWWSTDAISDTEFVNAIEFLVNSGIIITDKTSSKILIFQTLISQILM